MADQANTIDSEEWRDIPGYEGLYQISSHGRARSCDRVVVSNNRWKDCQFTWRGREITGRLDKDGYRKLTLSKEGKVTHMFAHRAVALAFIGEPPEGRSQVAHWDGDPANNQVGNLRWASAADNARDKVRHGRTADQFGERHSQNKFRNEDILAIRAEPQYRGVNRALAKRYAVHEQTIGKIRLGHRWPHLLKETCDGVEEDDNRSG